MQALQVRSADIRSVPVCFACLGFRRRVTLLIWLAACIEKGREKQHENYTSIEGRDDYQDRFLHPLLKTSKCRLQVTPPSEHVSSLRDSLEVV